MRKSAEQIGWDVLLKIAEVSAMPPPPDTAPNLSPPAYPPVPTSSAPAQVVEVPPSAQAASEQPEKAPAQPGALPTPEELEEMYRNTIQNRALLGTGLGAVAGGAAGGILTGGNPIGVLAGGAGLGLLGNRLGTSVGEQAALSKLEEATGTPWVMPGDPLKVK